FQEVLLEFRAGKMLMNGTRVIPDSRKGLVRIGRGSHGLVHFQWLDRTSNIVEDDQIIFPDEAVYEKVNQSSGRVYILKFHSDERKFFFWMQEPSADNDTQLCSSVNFHLNQPLEELAEEQEPDITDPETVDDDISSRAGNMVGQSTGGEAMGDVTSSGPVKLSDLQRILSNLGAPAVAEDPDAGLGLGDILKPELLGPVIEELPFHQKLSQFLPQGTQTREDLIELLQCPPFRQQLDSFTYLLRSGELDLGNFGVNPQNFRFTVPSFLEALEDSVSNASESGDS
ncbi:hypothetical protein M569_08044, partial [Genlisea aurea]